MKPVPGAGIGLLALLPLLFQVCEWEPNDTPATATPLQAEGGLLSEGRRSNGVLAAGALLPGDVDHFAFRVRKGELVTAALRDDTGGELADGVLALRGPGGGEPVARVDDVGLSLAPRLAFRARESGVHTLAVSGFGDDAVDGGDHAERFAYRLAVAVSETSPRLHESDRRGRNDDPRHADPAFLADARLVPRGAAVLSGRLTPGDVDHFLVPVPRGAVLVASVYDGEGGERHDPVLRLLDRRGHVLAEDDDAGPGFLARLEHAGPRAGALVLAVDGFDDTPDDGTPHTQDFRYRLVVSLEDALSP
jgi:hypothetical protein